MVEGGVSILACPRCSSLIVGASPCAYCGYVPRLGGFVGLPYPVPGFPYAPPLEAGPLAASAVRWRSVRWLRRTRWGLLMTSVGLFLSWTPFVAALGALFLSFGSTFLFLGARGAGRRHEVAVVLAFLLLAIGGVAIGFLLGAFLLQAYDAANAGRTLATLRDAAGLLIWATLPATLAITAAFGLQVALLLPHRQQAFLLALCAALGATAVLATWLSSPEVATLGADRVRAAGVADFLLRLSLYRMLEAPAYVGLGLLYLAAYAGMSPARSAPALVTRAEQG